MSLYCVCNKMELTLAIVLVGFVGAFQVTSNKELIKKAFDCIKNTIPNNDWMTGDVFNYDYIVKKV